MSTEKRNTAVILIAVTALIVGASVGYFMAPREVIRIENPIEYTPELASEDVILEEIRYEVTGLATLIYGAIGASLIAALAAIVSLMQISKQIAG